MKRIKSYVTWRLWRGSYFAVIILFSMQNVGCIHSRHIHHDSFPNERDAINEELAGKSVQIALLHDSKELTAKNVYLSADSVYYVAPKMNEQERIAISDVHRIIAKNRSRGAVEGFVGGLLTWGGAVGITIIATGGNFDHGGDGPGGGLSVYYTILGGAPLPVLGAIIGASVGSKKIYDFNKK